MVSWFQGECQPCNCIKKALQHGCFLVKIAKFLRTLILKAMCERLLCTLKTPKKATAFQRYRKLKIGLKWIYGNNNTAQKKSSFPLRISSVNVTKSAVSSYQMVTFTEEILNGKLHFLCSVK